MTLLSTNIDINFGSACTSSWSLLTFTVESRGPLDGRCFNVFQGPESEFGYLPLNQLYLKSFTI